MSVEPAKGLRTYRALLSAFPSRFREANGEEMERMYRDMREEWEEERGRAGLGFWLHLIWDIGRAAAAEWLSLSRQARRSRTATTVGEQMYSFLSDVRLAMRQAVRQPGHGLTIVVLMALGIAGNAAVFRVFNGLFLRPLPFPAAERLVDLDETAPQWDLEYVNVNFQDFAVWRRENTSFEAMTAFRTGGMNFADGASAERVDFLASTHDIDDVFGIEPLFGRFYTAEEDVPDGPGVALISSAYWRERFGGRRDVVGEVVRLDGRPVEIIGVLPAEAGFLGDQEFWRPLQANPDHDNGWGLSGVGRLRPGVSMEQATTDLTALHRALIPERSVNAITSPVIHSLRERYLGSYRLSSGFLLGAVTVILLIACANIAGLMFARALAREREMAVRRAMGAPRSRIVRQLLTESLILAFTGGAVGVALGYGASSELVARTADQFPRWVSFDLDGRFLAFTVVMIMGAAVIFALAPALQASSSSFRSMVSPRTTSSSGKRRLMGALVTVEVALAMTLLVVGGLSVTDLQRLSEVDPGFRAEGVLTYRIELADARYPNTPSRGIFARDYAELLDARPEIRGVSFANTLPLSGQWGWFFEAEGHSRGEDDPNPVVLNRMVTPGYFRNMGVEILQGRALTNFDGREPESKVVVVNETFVRTHLSHLDDPVGARVRTGQHPEWLTVVGVARDVKHYGVDEEMRPGVYQPWRQGPQRSFMVALITDGDPTEVTQVARDVTRTLDPELPLYDLRTMEDRLSEALWTRRATSVLITVFSSVALLLALAGIYGVITYTLGQRQREISIRMAVGAERTEVVRSTVGTGMRVVVLGAVIGIAASLAAGELVAGLLVRVSAREPMVYLFVTALLLGVALLANYLPARRVAELDPMEILRGD